MQNNPDQNVESCYSIIEKLAKFLGSDAREVLISDTQVKVLLDYILELRKNAEQVSKVKPLSSYEITSR